MSKKKGHIRQGDVLVIKTGKKVQAAKNGVAILARGEVSGHSHRVRNAGFTDGDDGLARELSISSAQVLEHEEHDSHVLEPQAYEVRVQRRVSVLGEVRKVMD